MGGGWGGGGAGGESKTVVTLAPALHNPRAQRRFIGAGRATFDTLDATARHPAALYVAVMRPVGQCLDT